MKHSFIILVFSFYIISCKHSTAKVVPDVFIDSIVSQSSPSLLENATTKNFQFWQQRMDSIPDDFVNGPELAGAYSSMFRLEGNIEDLMKADSLYQKAIIATNGKEAGFFRTLSRLAIQRHQFNRADSLLQIAKTIDGSNPGNTYLEFDILFEKGDYKKSKDLLQSLKKGESFGYLFRRAKMEHYDGSLDTAIHCMLQAAQKAGDNKSLKLSALSNAADLALHKADVANASNLYQQSLRIDAADMHSLTGLGWIAMMYEKNYVLAKKCFHFVQSRTSSPDVLLKLFFLAEAENKTKEATSYAEAFEKIATEPRYGNMYNKYLIDLYTGELKQPKKALELVKKELTSRPTAQVYAWYVWSLFSNGQTDSATIIYKGHVSAQPLEGLELYYMGKFMEATGKKYNANQFFKAAWKNRYDLSPGKLADLESQL